MKELITSSKTIIHCVHSDVQTARARFKGVMSAVRDRVERICWVTSNPKGQTAGRAAPRC